MTCVLITVAAATLLSKVHGHKWLPATFASLKHDNSGAKLHSILQISPVINCPDGIPAVVGHSKLQKEKVICRPRGVGENIRLLSGEVQMEEEAAGKRAKA